MMPSSCSLSMESFKRFPLYLYSDYVDQENETYSMVTNLTLGFNEERVKATGFGFFVSSLKNLQNGQGVMVVKGHSVVSGLGSTQQAYQYDGTKFCYFRNVTSSNYTILYDKVDNTCSKKNRPHVGLGLAKWWPFPARRAFPASSTLGYFVLLFLLFLLYLCVHPTLLAFLYAVVGSK